MNFQFAIIFGYYYDYEGENAETLQLFENLNQVDDIIEETMKEWSGLDYYMIGLIDEKGKINYTQRTSI
jgi:hypothetical protein